MNRPGGAGVNVDLFAGAGGWCAAAQRLGLGTFVGFELDPAACETRAAAGFHTVRTDVAAFPVNRLAGRVTGLVGSPPCLMFSAAGTGAGNAVTGILAAGIRDAFAGRATRAARRREMVTALRQSGWLMGSPAPVADAAEWRRKRQQALKRRLLARKGSPAKLARGMAAAAAAAGAHPVRAQRAARIWAAVRSASLVTEPARYIHACRPEWVALEQVPSVLPLWEVYAAELRKTGYSAWCGKLDAADYGVPQTRERAILIASRTRQVTRPAPTHYDPRKGMQLWGDSWVAMADALGWGTDGRPAPVVTAGGTGAGGAEPFGHRDRDMLAAERAAGRWSLRKDAQGHAAERPAPAPAPTISFGHAAGEMRWVFRNNNNACTRSLDEPAGTLFFGGRSNWAAWVTERPSTTVLGEGRIGRPGHKGRERGGESHFAKDSVRITVEEAAVLQSFPPGFPWKGSQTKQFQQCGNAIPPLLAEHVLAMATGARAMECAA